MSPGVAARSTISLHLQTVRDVGQVVGAVARDRLPGQRHHRDELVPRDATELTVEQLNEIFCSGTPGATIVDVEIHDGSAGTSTRQPMTLRYNDAGLDAGLPTEVYAKSTPTLVNRLLLGITGAAAAEACFYQSLRPQLQIGTPLGYFGSADPRSGRSMILMEDIARSRGAIFGDATSLTVDRPAAEQMLDEMARYHGAMWCSPDLDGTWPELRDARSWQQVFNTKTRMDAGAVAMVTRVGDIMPDALIARRKEIRGAFARSLDLNVQAPPTLLHQDVHPANWFRLPDGSLHLYDWQAIAAGHWALDVSYALSTCLTIDDRRAWERDLIAHYADQLAAHGGKPASVDQCFTTYRQQMLHGLVFWLYTTLVGKVAELQPPAHTELLVKRTAQAVHDLETLDSLELN